MYGIIFQIRVSYNEFMVYLEINILIDWQRVNMWTLENSTNILTSHII